MKISTYKKNVRSKKYIDTFIIDVVYKARHKNPNEDEFLRNKIFLTYIKKEDLSFNILECKLLKVIGEESEIETINLKQII